MSERPPSVTAPPFDEWVAARAPALLRFAYLLTGSQAEAEDAVQSALERALGHWSRIAHVDDPETYVRRIIVNEHISLWRRWRRRVSPVAVIRDTSATQGADPAAQVARTDAVRRLCAGLPATQRAAVVLRFYEDLDYREIAGLLDCAEATARSHVHRALEALRQGLMEEDHDE